MIVVGVDNVTHEYVDAPTGTNTGDQVGDGVTITGAGTAGDPFVSAGGGGTSDTPQTLTFATTITPVLADGNIMTLVLTANCTINIPSDLTDARYFKYRFIQGGAGTYTPTFASGYRLSGGVPLTQTGGIGAIDGVAFRGISTTEAEFESLIYDLKQQV
jgi:hypothetical protein